MSTEASALPNPAGSLVPASLKPLLLLLGVAAAVAAGVVIALWSQGTTYSLLYGDLGAEDAAKIVQALESAGIAYKLDQKTGAITVPSDKVHDARLKLAGQGLPEGDGGFAMISKDPGFGVSQFMESARYQHALELELARTISNLQAVSAARVHLALPRQSAFVRDRRSASASVFVQLKPGRRLESDQVQAIVNLVASSIPELEARQVTVVDQTGRLLSAPDANDEFAARDKQLQIARNMEELYTRRIEQLLQPLVGPGRVRAQVVADVEMSTTEEAREQYRPESQVVRSEQISEESARNGVVAGGVPGALSNQPPVPGTALAPGETASDTTTVASTSGPDSSSRQATKNYEIDRTVAYTKQPAGRLKRLTVAVLIDNLRTVNADGQVVETPLTPEQIENMTKLVREAVGFNPERGDSVSVVNASFRGEPAPEEIEPEEPSLLDNPLLRDIAKLVLGSILVLVLVLGVIRPLVRGLIAQVKPTAPRPVDTPALVGADGAQILPPEPGAAVPVKMDYETQVQQARAMVSQDPGRVAQVVKAWVQQDE